MERFILYLSLITTRRSMKAKKMCEAGVVSKLLRFCIIYWSLFCVLILNWFCKFMFIEAIVLATSVVYSFTLGIMQTFVSSNLNLSSLYSNVSSQWSFHSHFNVFHWVATKTVLKNIVRLRTFAVAFKKFFETPSMVLLIKSPTYWFATPWMKSDHLMSFQP